MLGRWTAIRLTIKWQSYERETDEEQHSDAVSLWHYWFVGPGAADTDIWHFWSLSSLPMKSLGVHLMFDDLKMNENIFKGMSILRRVYVYNNNMLLKTWDIFFPPFLSIIQQKHMSLCHKRESTSDHFNQFIKIWLFGEHKAIMGNMMLLAFWPQ